MNRYKVLRTQVVLAYRDLVEPLWSLLTSALWYLLNKIVVT